MGSVLYGKASAIAAQGTVNASRIKQRGNNIRQAAESSLARFQQNLANSRKLDAAGYETTAITENIAKNLEAATMQHAQTSIARSEELGRSVAAAAAAGIGGSSTEAYDYTLRTQFALSQEVTDRNVNRDLINASKERGLTMQGAANSLDYNVYSPNLDVTQYVDVKKPSLLGQIAAVAATAGATYVGGPQAGASVMGFYEGSQAARNGDFAGAASAANSALQNGLQAVKTVHDLGGKYWSSTKPSQSSTNNLFIK